MSGLVSAPAPVPPPSPSPEPAPAPDDHRVQVETHPLPLLILIRVVTFVAAWILFLWFKTCRVTVINGEREREWRKQHPMFYALWHRHVVWTIYFWRWRGGFFLASSSKDGEWAVGVIRAFRNWAVRGSSTRGGRNATAGMVAELQAGRSGGLLPDAPKGPARKAKIGALVVAQRAQVPIVPVAMACEHGWRLRNWDRTIVPRPFTRMVVKFGEPFHVDPSLGGEALEARRAELERVLNQITDDVDTHFGGEAELRSGT